MDFIKILKLVKCFHIEIWAVLLDCFDFTSNKLQSVHIKISDVPELYEILLKLLENNR